LGYVKPKGKRRMREKWRCHRRREGQSLVSDTSGSQSTVFMRKILHVILTNENCRQVLHKPYKNYFQINKYEWKPQRR